MSNTKQTNESGEKVVEVLSKTEQFLEKNKKRNAAAAITTAARIIHHKCLIALLHPVL